MSNDPKGAPAPRMPDPIRVKELRVRCEARVLPLRDPIRDGEATMTTIVAGKTRKGTTVEIDYQPWLRHHRVRELEGKELVAEFLVPESWAVFMPEPTVQ